MEKKSLRSHKKIAVLLVGLWVLSGCVSKSAAPITEYSLTIPHVESLRSTGSYSHSTLKVSYPESLTLTMTRDIPYSYSLSDQGVYQNSQWNNTIGKLIQGNVIRALEQGRNFKGVVSYASTAEEDFRLESSVYDFSHHIRGEASYAIVSIKFLLINTGTGKLIKTKKFSYKVPTTTIDARGFVEAANKAMLSLDNDLVRWLR